MKPSSASAPRRSRTGLYVVGGVVVAAGVAYALYAWKRGQDAQSDAAAIGDGTGAVATDQPAAQLPAGPTFAQNTATVIGTVRRDLLNPQPQPQQPAQQPPVLSPTQTSLGMLNGRLQRPVGTDVNVADQTQVTVPAGTRLALVADVSATSVGAGAVLPVNLRAGTIVGLDTPTAALVQGSSGASLRAGNLTMPIGTVFALQGVVTNSSLLHGLPGIPGLSIMNTRQPVAVVLPDGTRALVPSNTQGTVLVPVMVTA